MKKVINNKKNRELLAERVVNDASPEDVEKMAVNGCVELYEREAAKFHEDWDATFGY